MVEEQLTECGITETEETCTYEELSHTADVGIRLQANSPAALFACAGQAMFKLAGAVADDDSPATPRFVIVEAGDAESLMVAWLNELLYQHEVNDEIYLRCTVTAWKPTGLEATIHGYRPVAPPIFHIKAVTYHQLRVVEKEDGGWTAEIYFDI